jgi:ParB family chromosome partitioning protein
MSQTKKSGLGRGLNSLLGGFDEQSSEKASLSVEKPVENVKQNFHASKVEASHVVAAAPTTKDNIPDSARVWKIAVDKLSANKYQPRQEFREEKLKELADSIKEQGILQPIVARKMNDGKFEIVSGERRWRAAQMAGLHDVPVILRNIDDKKSLELAIIENIQRDDLNPIEEAEAYQKLAEMYSLTHQQIGQRVGKDRVTISNMMRLLSLTKECRQMLLENKITLGHAKVLLSVEEGAQQNKLARKIENEKWSVRELEKQVKGLQKVKSGANKAISLDLSQKLAQGLAEDMQKMIGTKVAIDYANGKGKISISFYSDDQLTQITENIKTAWK